MKHRYDHKCFWTSNLTVQSNCNFMIYKECVFGHSDDQIIFLKYFGSSSMVPGAQFLKNLEFPVVRARKVSFVMLLR